MKSWKGAYKKTVFISLFTFGIIIFWGFQVSALELNEAQKEVWKTVEASWDFIVKGDFKALSALGLERSIMWFSDGLHPRLTL